MIVINMGKASVVRYDIDHGTYRYSRNARPKFIMLSSWSSIIIEAGIKLAPVTIAVYYLNRSQEQALQRSH